MMMKKIIVYLLVVLLIVKGERDVKVACVNEDGFKQFALDCEGEECEQLITDGLEMHGCVFHSKSIGGVNSTDVIDCPKGVVTVVTERCKFDFNSSQCKELYRKVDRFDCGDIKTVGNLDAQHFNKCCSFEIATADEIEQFCMSGCEAVSGSSRVTLDRFDRRKLTSFAKSFDLSDDWVFQKDGQSLVLNESPGTFSACSLDVSIETLVYDESIDECLGQMDYDQCLVLKKILLRDCSHCRESWLDRLCPAPLISTGRYGRIVDDAGSLLKNAYIYMLGRQPVKGIKIFKTDAVAKHHSNDELRNLCSSNERFVTSNKLVTTLHCANGTLYVPCDYEGKYDASDCTSETYVTECPVTIYEKYPKDIIVNFCSDEEFERLVVNWPSKNFTRGELKRVWQVTGMMGLRTHHHEFVVCDGKDCREMTCEHCVSGDEYWRSTRGDVAARSTNREKGFELSDVEPTSKSVCRLHTHDSRIPLTFVEARHTTYGDVYVFQADQVSYGYSGAPIVCDGKVVSVQARAKGYGFFSSVTCYGTVLSTLRKALDDGPDDPGMFAYAVDSGSYSSYGTSYHLSFSTFLFVSFVGCIMWMKQEQYLGPRRSKFSVSGRRVKQILGTDLHLPYGNVPIEWLLTQDSPIPAACIDFQTHLGRLVTRASDKGVGTWEERQLAMVLELVWRSIHETKFRDGVSCSSIIRTAKATSNWETSESPLDNVVDRVQLYNTQKLNSVVRHYSIADTKWVWAPLVVRLAVGCILFLMTGYAWAGVIPWISRRASIQLVGALSVVEVLINIGSSHTGSVPTSGDHALSEAVLRGAVGVTWFFFARWFYSRIFMWSHDNQASRAARALPPNRFDPMRLVSLALFCIAVVCGGTLGVYTIVRDIIEASLTLSTYAVFAVLICVHVILYYSAVINGERAFAVANGNANTYKDPQYLQNLRDSNDGSWAIGIGGLIIYLTNMAASSYGTAMSAVSLSMLGGSTLLGGLCLKMTLRSPIVKQFPSKFWDERVDMGEYIKFDLSGIVNDEVRGVAIGPNATRFTNAVMRAYLALQVEPTNFEYSDTLCKPDCNDVECQGIHFGKDTNVTADNFRQFAICPYGYSCPRDMSTCGKGHCRRRGTSRRAHDDQIVAMEKCLREARFRQYNQFGPKKLLPSQPDTAIMGLDASADIALGAILFWIVSICAGEVEGLIFGPLGYLLMKHLASVGSKFRVISPLPTVGVGQLVREAQQFGIFYVSSREPADLKKLLSLRQPPQHMRWLMWLAMVVPVSLFMLRHSGVNLPTGSVALTIVTLCGGQLLFSLDWSKWSENPFDSLPTLSVENKRKLGLVLCDESDQRAESSTKGQTKTDERRSQIVCFTCKSPGHKHDSCPNKPKVKNTTNVPLRKTGGGYVKKAETDSDCDKCSECGGFQCKDKCLNLPIKVHPNQSNEEAVLAQSARHGKKNGKPKS
jgi:hypothetical protein